MAHLKADLVKTQEHHKTQGQFDLSLLFCSKPGTWNLNWSGTDEVETKATYIYPIISQ